MEHHVEVVSPVQRKVAVSVPSREVNDAINKAIRQFGANLAIDGFRKGKVPAAVIEKRFPGEILPKAKEIMASAQIPQILDQEKLRPINQVRTEGGRLERDTDFNYSFLFEVLPDIAIIEDLTALSVEVPDSELTGADTDALTLNLRQTMARLEPVAERRHPEYGDVVLLSMDGTVDGEPAPSLKADNYLTKLGQPEDDRHTTEIDKTILSLYAGEEGSGDVSYPEDHIEPALRGKTAHFTVKLHAINKEVMPELDDELAKKVGFDDLEQLKSLIFAQARNRKIQEAKNQAQQNLLDSVIDSLDYPLPESLVSIYLNDYLAQARNYLTRQGVDGGEIGKALESMREEGLIQARMKAKGQAFLLALGLRENIQVSQQEIDAQIMQMAQQTRQDFQQLKGMLWQSGVVDELHDRLMAAKALDLMYEKAEKVPAKERSMAENPKTAAEGSAEDRPSSQDDG